MNFAFTRSGIKGDIISLYWNEFDSVSSLVAQSKQTQQAFGLAYWCPVGVGLWAKMKICTVWFRGKMSSTLPLFPPALRFFQRSVFIPCSLVSPRSPSRGFSEERVGDRYGDLSVCARVDFCDRAWEYAHAGIGIMWWKMQRGVQWLQWHLVDSPAGTRVQSQIRSHRLPSEALTTVDSFVGVLEFGDL